MTLEKRKQLDTLICEEVNVKKYSRLVCGTEKGDIHLVFNCKSQEYFFTLSHVPIETSFGFRAKMIPKILNITP